MKVATTPVNKTLRDTKETPLEPEMRGQVYFIYSLFTFTNISQMSFFFQQIRLSLWPC